MHAIALEELGGWALDADARRGLRAALKDAGRAGGALVIAGGPGSWQHERQPGDARAAHRDFHSLLLAVVAHPAPVVAAVAGEATGFGLALAAAADVRLVAADAAFRVTEPGSALETGAYRLLVRLLGRARADHLVYTGVPMTGEEASALSFASAELGSADAERLADTLVTPGAAAVKRAAIAGLVPALTEELQYDAWLALSAAGEAP
ncbi:enoyl-CoA hydratase/isomerase family protein [Agrococcus citreus]|uniref:Enoyl-CoA hydratase n=1 Tax=Agrococcus citreus TaxID=84643 RepID=A0ABP4JMB9_9MICO